MVATATADSYLPQTPSWSVCVPHPRLWQRTSGTAAAESHMWCSACRPGPGEARTEDYEKKKEGVRVRTCTEPEAANSLSCA